MSGGFREKKRKRVSSSPNTCSKQQYTTSATETVHVPTIIGFANMEFSDGSGSGDEFENHSQMNSDQKLDLILMKLNKMESKLDKLSRKVIQVEGKVELNEAKIFDLNTRLDNMPTKEDYAKLEEKLDDQSNRLRRNNIVLHNVPEESEGKDVYDCARFVKDIIENHMKMENDSGSWCIERAHRSPTGPPRFGRTRPIHVKFLKYQDRVDILKAAPKKLRNNPVKTDKGEYNVYISDDVSEKVRKERKTLVVLKKKIKDKWPERKCFIPPSVPAVLLREDENGKLIRMRPGDKLELV